MLAVILFLFVCLFVFFLGGGGGDYFCGSLEISQNR